MRTVTAVNRDGEALGDPHTSRRGCRQAVYQHASAGKGFVSGGGTRDRMTEESPDIDDLLDTLEETKRGRKETRDRDRCDNCRRITESTDVTIEDRGRRSLHYCATCERLLTTREFERWKAVGGYR